jgi:hypothetical protein
VLLIVALLGEGDRGVLIPHSHAQRRAARADGERPVSQLSGEIKRLHRRLFARQAQRVLGHLCLDRRSDLRSRPEEPVGGREALEPLMGALEVVVLDEQVHPPLAVLEVGEHRPGQQLLPQRLPEPLDLAAGLRMMRPALHVLDAMTLQLRLELGAPAPGGVLAALVGQDLPRRAVLGDAPRQRFQHQHASLVVRHRQTHQVPRVIVQERRHVQPLVPPQQEREDVRLPQLIGFRPLEVLHRLMAAYPSRHHLRLDAFGLQYPAHRRRRHPDPQEAPHQITDPSAAGAGLGLPGSHDRPPLRARRLLEVRSLRSLARFERGLAKLPVRLHPLHRGCVRHP